MKDIAATSKAQVQALYHAGLATHVVTQGAAVDPLFALAKARDFPQVAFAAAFEDGLVVLGCPDGLPDALQDYALAIQPTDEAAPDNPFKALCDRMEALEAALADKPVAPVDDRLHDKIDKLMEQGASGAKIQSDLSEAIADLGARFTNAQQQSTVTEAFGTALEAVQEQTSFIKEQTHPLGETLALLRQECAAGFKALANDEIAPAGKLLLDQFTILESKLATSIGETLDHSVILAKAEELGAAQEQMHGKLTHIANDIATFCAIEGSRRASEDVEQNRELVEMLQSIAPPLTKIFETLPQVQEAVVNLDLQPREHASTASFSIALTEQRQSLARFQTAMGTVVSRLEACLGTIESQPPQAVPLDPTITDTLSGMTRQLELLTCVPDNFASIEPLLRSIPDMQADLANQIAQLGARPGPVIDLSEQRRSLASFGNTLNAMVKRLELRMQDTVCEPAGVDVSSIEEKLDKIHTLCRNPLTQDHLETKLARHTEAIEEVQIAIAEAVSRPAPVLDLTQQRSSLAQFASALSVTLRRFDRIAARLEETNTAKSNAREDIFGEPTTTLEATDAQAEITQNETHQISTFDPNAVSIEAMRYSFAELIALQIMKNETGSAPSSDIT